MHPETEMFQWTVMIYNKTYGMGAGMSQLAETISFYSAMLYVSFMGYSLDRISWVGSVKNLRGKLHLVNSISIKNPCTR